MTKLFPCAALLALASCATAPMSSLPMPTDRKIAAVPPEPEPEVKNITIEPIGEGWELAGINQEVGEFLWVNKTTIAVLTLQVHPYEKLSPDSALEKLLTVLGEHEVTDDVLQFPGPGLNVLRWTDGDKRGFACVRAFPNANGPLTFTFIGFWPPGVDDAMAAEALSACREINLGKK